MSYLLKDFYHNFKHIPCYVMSEESLKGFILLYLMMDFNTLKTLKLAFIGL